MTNKRISASNDVNTTNVDGKKETISSEPTSKIALKILMT